MRTVSIRDLHIRTSEIVREVEEDGAPTIVERRGQPVAELRAVRGAPPLSPEEKELVFERMRKFWDDPCVAGDSTVYLEEDRDR